MTSPPATPKKRAPAGLLPKVDQTRKLITQILGKLKKREKPPSVFQALEVLPNDTGGNASFISLSGAYGPNDGNGGISTGSELEDHSVFSADETCNLLSHLRDVLVVCKFNGIIFGDRLTANTSPPDSPFSSREHSPTRSRSQSPTRAKEPDSAILTRIMHILSDIIQNDCRYKVSVPRPFQPPNALQTIALDIAFVLIDQNPYSPSWLYELGMTMLPAFNCFDNGLQRKLLVFYEMALLPQLMACSSIPDQKNNRNEYRGRGRKSLLNDFENSGHINITIEDSGSVIPRSPVAIEIHSPIDDDYSPERSNEYKPHRGYSHQQISRRMSITFKKDPDIEDYYIDSMFTPLLYSIVKFIDVQISSLETIYQMHRTLAVMIKYKPHLYYDLMEVVAYGDASSRGQAVNMLFYFWSYSSGHPVIGRSLLNITYLDDLKAKEEQQAQQLKPPQQKQSSKKFDVRMSLSTSNDEHLHQFIPHIYVNQVEKSAGTDKQAALTNPKSASLTEMRGQFIPTENQNGCMQCFESVHGFGLRCSGCKLNVHFKCYNGGFLTEYVLDSGVHKLSTPRFCHVLQNPREAIISKENIDDFRASYIPITVETKDGHKFRLVNLFTLVLCTACHEPLWGIMHQGYRCERCNHLVHVHCLSSHKEQFQSCSRSSGIAAVEVLIDQGLLRQSFVRYYQPILVSHEALASYAAEELSVMISVLEMQDNILKNGILAGCLSISNQHSNHPLSTGEEQLEQFELQKSITLYKKYFFEGERLDVGMNVGMGVNESIISQEYWEGVCPQPINSDSNNLNENIRKTRHPWILCEEEYLGHLVAFMKSGVGFEFEVDSGGDVYLGVSDTGSGNKAMTSTSNDDDFMPVDMLSTSEMIRWVKNNLGFQGVFTSRILLQQMANLGYIEGADGRSIIFSNLFGEHGTNRDKTYCTFPIPFGIECSSSVETVILAIIACLSDLNITINECGLLLLTRRFWPNAFLSRYTLERLAHAIIEYICDEDDKLLIIAKEYTSSRSKLPGVRDEVEDDRSVNGGTGHQKRASTFNNAGGGAYVISRKMLKEKYITGWLSAIEQINHELFVDVIYSQLESVAKDRFVKEEDIIDQSTKEHQNLKQQEHILRCIVKLWIAGLLVSSYNDIMARWLDNAYKVLNSQSIGEIFVDLKSLQRIFINSSAKRISAIDHLSKLVNESSVNHTEPLNVFTRVFVEGDDVAITRGLQWMELLVRGGIGFPGSIYAQFLPLLVDTSPTIDKYTAFMTVLWYQVIGGNGYLLQRSEILELITNINEASLDLILHANESGNEADISNARSFVKITLALTLYSYACPLDFISTLKIVNAMPQQAQAPNPPKRISAIPDQTPGTNLTIESSLINCLLQYSCLERIAIGGYVARGFWGLCTAGALIYNKSELLSSCTTRLLTCIWKELPPLYDNSSELTMSLLMRLIWSDARTFRVSVSKVFEHENWEVRFDGLDNLYGLFSKLDEKYEVQWTGVLTNLGPIFSFFVACLWDKEEFVRTKAISYIRAMQPTHVRAALKCWQGYFETANIRERTLLVKLMIRLNAQFPDWQVIQWGSLLSALTHESGESEHVSTTDILDSYMRPDSVLVIGVKHLQEEGISTPGQKVAEEKNLKVLMLTLGLQMVGNGIEISKQRLIELKLVVMQSLGFADCRLENFGGQMQINHGEFCYVPDDFSQNMKMITCLGNLKKVLDIPIYLKPSESEIIGDTEVELVGDLIGGYFVDTVLGIFNSSVDILSLSHLMLKTLFELLLIIVYKHKIEDRRNKDFEENIVNTMRRISELLAKDISDENKQLIIEICTCLLKRSPNLTVNFLGKLIITLGKLMTKLGFDHTNPLIDGSTGFLKTAFLKFARNGLFVLIFKNQVVADENNMELDMFRVLRKVIGNDLIPSEDETQQPTYLREQPVRDVINQLFKFSARKIVSTILFNLNKYVQLVFSHPYGEQLIAELGLFFTKLAKHTSEWKHNEWDVNPTLSVAATILKEHPMYAKVLVPHIKNLWRHAIQKCNISMESLTQLLGSYALVVEDRTNVFGEIIIEELKSSFRGNKSKLSKDTTVILLQAILSDMDPASHPWFQQLERKLMGISDKPLETTTTIDSKRSPYFSNVAENLFDDCVNFLENPTNIKQYSKKEFKVGVCIGQLVVSMCNKKYDLLTKIFLWQKATDARRTIRLLNWILICMSKSEASSLGLITTIFDFQDNICDLLIHALRKPFNEVLVAESNYLYTSSGELAYNAFVLIKIWTVLCEQASKFASGGGKTTLDDSVNSATRVHRRLAVSLSIAERRFWNSIWPSMRNQLTSSINGDDVQLNSVAFWEMFMDLITFLHLCGSETVMIYAQEWSALLDSLISGGEESRNEFKDKIRQARAMFDDPPLMMPQEILTTQLFTEMREAMRLYFEVNSNTAMRFFGGQY